MVAADTASQWAGASHAAGARRSHRWVLEPEAARDRALWTEGPSRGGAAAKSAARRPHSSARASAAVPRELLRAEGGLASRRPRTRSSPTARAPPPPSRPGRAARETRPRAAWAAPAPRRRSAAEPRRPRSRVRGAEDLGGWWSGRAPGVPAALRPAGLLRCPTPRVP